jgi:hypothetical protein
MPPFHYSYANPSDLIVALQQCHDAGIDPAFDSEMEELERQFAELRISQARDLN